MKTRLQAILWAMALVTAGAAKGSPLEAPELVSQTAGSPGGAASGGDGFALPVCSPVLDDGTVFFLSEAAFSTYDSNGVVDLYVAQSGTVNYVSLAAVGTDSGNAEAVRASADGSVLALLREPSGFSDYPKVAILRRSGASVTEAAVDQNPDIAGVALSADGTHLAFVTPTDGLVPVDSNGRGDLFHCPVAETAARQYIPTASAPTRLGISSDGAVIAFLAGGSLYVHTVAGGTTTALAAAGNAVTSAALAASGDWIAFVSADNLAGDTDGLDDVFRIRSDGTGLERVSVMPTGTDFPVGVSSGDTPAINADGRYVAFSAPVPGGSVPQLWVRDAAVGRTVCASAAADTTANAACGAPALSPSGQYLTFCSEATNLAASTGGVSQVYRVNLGGDWSTSGGSAPVAALVDDLANIIVWQWVEGHESASEYEISLDGGATWRTPDGNPYNVGNVAVDPGLILIRLQATPGTGSGDSLVLSAGLTAAEEGNLPLWSVAIACPSLGADAVFGMAGTAQAAGGALPDQTAGGICFLDESESPLAADLRADSGEADWLLTVRSPAESGTTWVWTLPEGFPASYYLSLWQVNGAGEPVGATALDLDHTRTFALAAGEERRFRVRFAADRTVDVALAMGWNQISLPVIPPSSLLTAVFADADGTPLVKAEGLRLADGSHYEAITEVAALDPVWVSAPAAAHLLVRGMPANLAQWTLAVGWNLVSVPHPVSLSSVDFTGGTLGGAFLEWDAASLRYNQIDTLLPTRVCWIYAQEAFAVPLPGN